MIRRYDCILTVIDQSKDKMLALKFNIIDGRLYVFNYYDLPEKRKMIEVKSINGISVKSFINEINSDDLYNIDKMKEFGINTEDSFVLDLIVDEKTIEYDVYDYNSPDEIFRKKFAINKNIDSKIVIDFDENSSENNKMLNYASTNIKCILSILNSIAVSTDDKKLISNLLNKITQFNDTYADTKDNLDMIFLSTGLLLLDSEIHNVPQYIQEMMQSSLYIDFGTDDYKDTNNSILTDDKIDYRKVVVMIRNCIAHSNYKVLDNGLVEFYNFGKNKLHFTIHKNKIKSLLSQLYKFYYLEGTFPIIYTDYIVTNPEPFSKDELIKYLNELELFECNYTFKTFDNDEKQNRMDRNLIFYNLSSFHVNLKYSREYIIDSFERNIKNHFNDDCELENHKITDGDIEYILFNIKNMGEDHFYELGRLSQIKIINTLIKRKYNKNGELLNYINEIMDSKYDSNDSLTKSSSDYIKIQTKIELLIIALINNIFLFCYNQNPATINATSIRFPKKVYTDFLKTQVELFYNYTKEYDDYKAIYDSLLKIGLTKEEINNDYYPVINNISKWKNKIIQYKNSIESINQVLDGTADDKTYNLVNKNIIYRIRHCLAHKLIVNCYDFSNIRNSEIILTNKFEGQTFLNTTMSLEEIINAINHTDFLQSILDNNQHFKNNSI